ncbi:unnamed protein product [Boreogadus saida]
MLSIMIRSPQTVEFTAAFVRKHQHQDVDQHLSSPPLLIRLTLQEGVLTWDPNTAINGVVLSDENRTVKGKMGAPACPHPSIKAFDWPMVKNYPWPNPTEYRAAQIHSPKLRRAPICSGFGLALLLSNPEPEDNARCPNLGPKYGYQRCRPFR